MGVGPLPPSLAAVRKFMKNARLAAEDTRNGVPLLCPAQGVERLFATGSAAAILDDGLGLVVVVGTQLRAALISEFVFAPTHAADQFVSQQAGDNATHLTFVRLAA